MDKQRVVVIGIVCLALMNIAAFYCLGLLGLFVTAGSAAAGEKLLEYGKNI